MGQPKKDFTDKKFTCEKCQRHLADERIDRQILVFDKIAVFNFCRLVCLSCNTVNRWQSPNLNKAEKLEEYPDNVGDVPQPKEELLKALQTL